MIMHFDDPEYITEWEINETQKQYKKLGLEYVAWGYSRRGKIHMPPRVYGAINRTVVMVIPNPEYL